MTEDRPEERRRAHQPAWATVPTMPWSRVIPGQRPGEEDEPDPDEPAAVRVRHNRDDNAPVSPAVTGGGPPARPATGSTDELPGGRLPTGDRGQARVPVGRPVERPLAERSPIERGRPERRPEQPERVPGRGRSPRRDDIGQGPGSGARPPAARPDGRQIGPPAFAPGLHAGSGVRLISPDALTAPTPPGGMPAVPDSAPISGAPVAIAIADRPVDLASALGLPAADLAVAERATVDGAAPESPVEDTGPDPEHVLAAWEWSFDPETLRERADDEDGLREIRDQLTAKLNKYSDNASRARLLEPARGGLPDPAATCPRPWPTPRLALAHAEATGELRRIAIAQARLAHVLEWRGEFDEADRLFTQANSTELPDRLRADHAPARRQVRLRPGPLHRGVQPLRDARWNCARTGPGAGRRDRGGAGRGVQPGRRATAGDRTRAPATRSCDPQAADARRWTSGPDCWGFTDADGRYGRSRPSSPTCSRSATASPGCGRSASRPGS